VAAGSLIPSKPERLYRGIQPEKEQMKKIDTLIRLHKFTLDECRRELRMLEEKMAALVKARENMDVELAEEQQKASEDMEYARTYSGYAQLFIRRREEMEQAIENLKPELDKAEIKVQMAFQELKKYEITAERQAAAEHKETLRVEQIELDDTASAGHARKKKN
jgi:flagellar export protein FliJ